MRLDPSQCADLSRRPGREPALYTRNYYPDLLMSFYSMSSWTGSALIRVIILRLGSHQSAQRLENREISQTPPHSPHSVSLSHAPSLFGKAQSRRRPLQAQRQVANESRKRSRHKQWPFLFMAVSNSNSKLIIHTQSPTANIQKRLHM